MWGISCLAGDLLSSEEGLYSMELLSSYRAVNTLFYGYHNQSKQYMEVTAACVKEPYQKQIQSPG